MRNLLHYWRQRNVFLSRRQLQSARATSMAVACACGGTLSLPADRFTGAKISPVETDARIRDCEIVNGFRVRGCYFVA